MDLTHAEFEDKVRKALAPITNPDDIIILDVTYKPAINLKSLYLIVNEDMVRYTDIHPELQVDLGDCEVDLVFYYIYVPKPEDPTVNLDEERKKIAKLLKPVFDDLYPASNAEYRIAGNREYSVGVPEILLGNSDGVFTVELLAKHCEAG